MAEKMKQGSKSVVESLINHHVDYVFGIPGAKIDGVFNELKEQAKRVNDALVPLFKQIGLQLIDFKLEFGKTSAGAILLGDEISPDTCRLWDLETEAHMDKDVYRRKIGEIVPVYQEVLNRLEKINQ